MYRSWVFLFFKRNLLWTWNVNTLSRPHRMKWSHLWKPCMSIYEKLYNFTNLYSIIDTLYFDHSNSLHLRAPGAFINALFQENINDPWCFYLNNREEKVEKRKRAVHEKRSESRYLHKFCLIPLHRRKCFTHTSKKY